MLIHLGKEYKSGEVEAVILFEPELVKINVTAKDQEDILKKLVQLLVDSGKVKPEYYEDVIERERTFPTGLPTDGVMVAIPHAKSENVLKSGIAVGVLKEPVKFYNMENPDEALSVRIVYLLASMTADEQLDNLKVLMECFSESDILQKMVDSKTTEEVMEIIKVIA